MVEFSLNKVFEKGLKWLSLGLRFCCALYSMEVCLAVLIQEWRLVDGLTGYEASQGNTSTSV